MISKATLKYVRGLKLKKYRTKERKFLVEGDKSIKEVLASDMKVDMVLIGERSDIAWEGDTYRIDQKTLESVSSLSSNENSLAVVQMPEEVDVNQLDLSGVNIILDGINDPGNLGTIIRTLDWFGYQTVFCTKDTVDFYNPKTIAATMGSFTRIIPYYIDVTELIRSSGFPVYGMQMSGSPLNEIDLVTPSYIIMGSESHGIRPPLSNLIDHSVTIPGIGQAESLNVAVATGMLLYEIATR
jgi:TrmH family RNA methyltransferase